MFKACERVNTTYTQFLDSFGLSKLPKVRKENILLMGNEESVNAELYQGLAAYFSGTVEQGGYNNVVNEVTTSPFLATAFTRPHQGKP